LNVMSATASIRQAGSPLLVLRNIPLAAKPTMFKTIKHDNAGVCRPRNAAMLLHHMLATS